MSIKLNKTKDELVSFFKGLPLIKLEDENLRKIYTNPLEGEELGYNVVMNKEKTDILQLSVIDKNNRKRRAKLSLD